MNWHKGPSGSWWREREGVKVTIERDYIALTSTTYWTVRGLARFEERSFTTLKKAKSVVNDELTRLAAPAAVERLRQHCDNGLQCIMTPHLKLKSCICICYGCKPGRGL